MWPYAHSNTYAMCLCIIWMLQPARHIFFSLSLSPSSPISSQWTKKKLNEKKVYWWKKSMFRDCIARLEAGCMQNRFVRNASIGRILEIFQRIKYIYLEKKGWFFFLIAFYTHIKFMHFHFSFGSWINSVLFFSATFFFTVNAFSTKIFFSTILSLFFCVSQTNILIDIIWIASWTIVSLLSQLE